MMTPLSTHLLALLSVISPGAVVCRRASDVELQAASKGRFLPPYVWYYAHGTQTMTKKGDISHYDTPRYKIYFNTLTGEWVRDSAEEGEGATDEMKSRAKFLPFQILTKGTCKCNQERNAICKDKRWYDWETAKNVTKRCWCDVGTMVDLVENPYGRCVPMPGVCMEHLRRDRKDPSCPQGTCQTGLATGCRPEKVNEVDYRVLTHWKTQVKRHWEKVTSIYTEESIEDGILWPSRAVYPVGTPVPSAVWFWAETPQWTRDGVLPMEGYERQKVYMNMQTGEGHRGAEEDEYGSAALAIKPHAKFLPLLTLTEGTCKCSAWRNAHCLSASWYDWGTQTSVKNRCWCDPGWMVDLIDYPGRRCVPMPHTCHKEKCKTGCATANDGCRPLNAEDKVYWRNQLRLHWQKVSDLYQEQDIEEGYLSK